MKKAFTRSVRFHKRACLENILPRAVRDLRRSLAQFRGFAILTGALALVMPVGAFAQNSAIRPRITTPINASNLTTLRGNTHPLARPRYDQGSVADSQPMRRMLLLLQRSPEQETALRTLIDQQQSKTSPNYHQWLTPQQFGQQFGPAPADIQTVTDWLTSQGFQVARVSTGGTLIEFSGTAGEVRNAFHTQIHLYNVNGEVHYANATDPQIPTAIAAVVAGPVSLNNFPHKPLTRKLGVFQKTKTTGKVAPLFTFSNQNFCGTTDCNALGPGDFATIYNVLPLWNTGISGTKIDGTNQSIAIVGDSEICTAKSPDWNTSYIGPYGTPVTCSSDDVAQFRSLFGLPANSPNVILDGPDPGFNGDETEGDLDVEWSGAVAKGATIDYVIAQDTETTAGTDLAAEYIVDNNLAPVLSESYGECEGSLGTIDNYYEATLWEQAAAQGITVVVSAGDSGSAGCDDPNMESTAQYGPAVNGIASTPFNVAAGGTDFDVTASNYQSTYWNAANNGPGGVNDTSALSYIPETTWNDSCAQNFTGAISGCAPENGGIVGGGGGQSNCAAQDTAGNCYYYQKPSWQTVASGSGLTLANDLTRDLPDISLFAADGYVSNSFYVICESDANQGGATCNLNTSSNTLNFFDFIGVGGTSSAAPTFAGMMALVNQNMAVNYPSASGRQGNANYVLYNLASAQSRNGANCNSSSSSLSSSCTFNDITKGNNAVPCYGGSFGCSNASTASGAYGAEETFNLLTNALTGNVAWNTAPGLDLATGLGSVNAFNLVNNWPTAGPFTPTATTLCLSLTETTSSSCPGPITITHGQTVYVNTEVTAGGSAIPVTETFPTTAATNAGADPYGPVLAEDVSLVGTFPTGNPNCTVVPCSTGAIDQFTSNSYNISNYDIYGLTNGTTVGANSFTRGLVGGSYNVTAHYSGDGTYGSSFSRTPIPVTVIPEPSTALPCVMIINPVSGVQYGGVLEGLTSAGALTYSCTPPGTSAYYGDFVLLRADVIGTSSGQESATGNVTLYDNAVAGVVNSTGGTTSSFPLNSEGYTEDQTTFFGVGSHSFSVKYAGDASYSAMAAPSAGLSLSVAAAPTTTQITSPSNGATIASGQPVTITAFVDTYYPSSNPSGGSLGNPPTGTVTFTSSTGGTLGTINVTPATDASGYVAGAASLTFTPSATLTVTAAYTPTVNSGVANYLTSCAGTSPCAYQGVLINVGTQGISAPQAGCSSSTINITAPGQSGSCLITVTGLNSFAGTITLSASVAGAPSGAVDLPICSFGAPSQNFTAPGTITLSSNSETGSATMTCSTTAASAVFFWPSDRPSSREWPMAGALVSLVCFLILLIIPRERRWRLVPLAVLLVVVAAAGISCGSSSSSGSTGPTNSGTTAGTYTINVTATPSTGSVQQTPITLNVQ